MKRFSILFLAIATVAMASAQTKIEKLFNEIDSLPVKELLSKSHLRTMLIILPPTACSVK